MTSHSPTTMMDSPSYASTAVPSDSILFSGIASSRSTFRRATMTSDVAEDSQHSWAPRSPSDTSLESTQMGHNLEDELEEFLYSAPSIIVPTSSNDAIFGSISQRRRGSAASSSLTRASMDSMRSSTIGTASTPLSPASLRETTRISPKKDFVPLAPRPRLTRLVSDSPSHTGSYRDNSFETSAKRSASRRMHKIDHVPIVLNQKSKSNRDDLMLAMAQLEQELERTMVTLSSPLASPVPSFSKASTRSKSRSSKRPSTADGTADGISSIPSHSLHRQQQPSEPPSSPSPVPYGSPARLLIPRFESESWGKSLIRQMEDVTPTPTCTVAHTFNPRPTSQISISSTTSNCSHQHGAVFDSDSVSVPSLIFEGRRSGSSGTSSSASSALSQSVPQSRDFVTGGKSSRPDQYFATGHQGSKFATFNNRSTSVKPSFYASKHAARSVPTLSVLPPCEPLPPLPPTPAIFKSSGDAQVIGQSTHAPLIRQRSSSGSVVRKPVAAIQKDVQKTQEKPLPSVPISIPVAVAPIATTTTSMQSRAKRAMSLRRLFA